MRISRKLIVACVTVLALVLERMLGIGLDDDTRNQIVAVVGAYLVGQGLADFAKEGSYARAVFGSDKSTVVVEQPHVRHVRNVKFSTWFSWLPVEQQDQLFGAPTAQRIRDGLEWDRFSGITLPLASKPEGESL